MAKLNQIIAVEKGQKTRTFEEFAKIDKRLQRRELLSGLARTYKPRDEEGDELPPESKSVQLNAEDAINEAAGALSKLFNVVATKEWANTEASADVVVDGQVIVADVPVGFLLFLEKQLVDIHTFVKRLPTLPADTDWTYDSNVGAYKSEPVTTTKTTKVLRNHEKWVPPDPSYKQPAQVETYSEDVVVGYWTKTDFSGALPVDEVKAMVKRVEALQEAVKFAREEANSREVVDQRVAEAIFEYLI